jgi:uncharacterized protein (TIGR03086 family)
MVDVAERYRNVAQAFTTRVTAVHGDTWGQPSPCEGWTARDIVRHMVETSAMFLGRVNVDVPPGPSVDDDPMGAWTTARDTVQAALDDPSVAGREFESPMGTMTLEKMVGMFGIGDVLVHTWDLSRAAGLDDRLDPEEVHNLLVVMTPNDAMMRNGTAFGPKVPVPDDADEQTQLIAFTGRRP